MIDDLWSDAKNIATVVRLLGSMDRATALQTPSRQTWPTLRGNHLRQNDWWFGRWVIALLHGIFIIPFEQAFIPPNPAL